MVGAFRTVRDFLLNSAVATIGVKIGQDAIGPVFRTETYTGSYLKAIVLGIVLAFGLGYAVYLRWRSRAAFWLWLVGVCTFGWRMALANPNPDRATEPGYSDTLAFLSVQCVFYSLGALCCWWIGSTEHSGET